MSDDNTKRDAEPSPASAGSRPVAWAVMNGEKPLWVWYDKYADAPPHAVPLYRQPTLTNDEEEAIRGALGWLLWCEQNRQIGDGGRKDIATLRALLERLT